MGSDKLKDFLFHKILRFSARRFPVGAFFLPVPELGELFVDASALGGEDLDSLQAKLFQPARLPSCGLLRLRGREKG